MLIKYSGKYVKIYFDMKITFYDKATLTLFSIIFTSSILLHSFWNEALKPHSHICEFGDMVICDGQNLILPRLSCINLAKTKRVTAIKVTLR